MHFTLKLSVLYTLNKSHSASALRGPWLSNRLFISLHLGWRNVDWCRIKVTFVKGTRQASSVPRVQVTRVIGFTNVRSPFRHGQPVTTIPKPDDSTPEPDAIRQITDFFSGISRRLDDARQSASSFSAWPTLDSYLFTWNNAPGWASIWTLFSRPLKFHWKEKLIIQESAL